MKFDGQQSDEKVLYVITPHNSKLILSIFFTTISILAVGAFLFGVTTFFPEFINLLRTIIVLMLLLGTIIAGWWIWQAQVHDRTYITDRRIIRFDVVSPFFTNKRALFWNEVLKAKAYAPNMIIRILKIGVLQIEPVAAEHESIIIPDVYYHEDLANYLDKILFTFKNKPADMTTIKPFIAKPKGKRD